MGPNGPSIPGQAEISISILALAAAEMGDLQYGRGTGQSTLHWAVHQEIVSFFPQLQVIA